MNAETMNLYEALREMEATKDPFSITFDSYSKTRGEGGERIRYDNMLFAGRKESEHYELVLFRSVLDDSLLNVHLYSLVMFNQSLLII